MGIRHRRSLAALAVASAVVALPTTPQVEAAPVTQRAAFSPCTRGLVALTFDDGPSRSITPPLLDLLDARDTPATFFVVGQRVAAAPKLARRMHVMGFKLGNHTYAHESLTALSNSGIVSTLRRTRRAVTRAGAEMSTLMRPPYGLIDSRVRSVVTGMGLVPVMWTIDPRDWTDIGSATIADRVIGGLRPDRTNVVLLHDGVGNSGSTLRAVPDIIRRARNRGYCFAELGANGAPKPPVPRAKVSGAEVRELTGQGTGLRFTVRLDRPTSRPTSLRVATSGRSAEAGKDFGSVSRRVRFPVGATRRTVSVPVLGDARDESRETLRLTASDPRGLTLADKSGVGVIRDDDAPPGVRLADVTVTEPAEGSVPVPVMVDLTAPSGRWVLVRVETRSGTAGADDFAATEVAVWFPPGEVSSAVPVEVVADAEVEGAEQFSLVVVATRHATVVDGTAVITLDEPL